MYRKDASSLFMCIYRITVFPRFSYGSNLSIPGSDRILAVAMIRNIFWNSNINMPEINCTDIPDSGYILHKFLW
jgi:hypothetical protein